MPTFRWIQSPSNKPCNLCSKESVSRPLLQWITSRNSPCKWAKVTLSLHRPWCRMLKSISSMSRRAKWSPLLSTSKTLFQPGMTIFIIQEPTKESSKVISTHTRVTITTRPLLKVTPWKKRLEKSSRIRSSKERPLSLPIFFREPKSLRWRE